MMRRTKRIFVVILTIALACPVIASAGKSETNIKHSPIIDVHAHAIDLSFYSAGGKWPLNSWTGEKTTKYTNESLKDELLARMKQYNIVRAVVSGKLEDVYRLKQADPDRIITASTLGGPYDVEVNTLRNEIEAGRLEALGELFTQYYGMEFTDPKVMPYYALAEELDVPIGVHTGLSDPDEIREYGLTEFRAHLGNPINIEEVLVKHPRLRLILQHMGVPFMQETIAILSMYRNVYVDIATIAYFMPKKAFYSDLKKLIDYGFGTRILFGTDVYLWPHEQIKYTIEAIESADFLTEEQKDDIFCNNGALFLKLDPSICDS